MFQSESAFGWQPGTYQEETEQELFVCVFAACCCRDMGSDGIQESWGGTGDCA